MDEMKPCPFCGGKGDCNNSALRIGGVFKWTVECLGCGLVTPGFETEEEAIEFWNRRTENEELKFTRNFIHEHGLEYALLSAWNRRANHGAE